MRTPKTTPENVKAMRVMLDDIMGDVVTMRGEQVGLVTAAVSTVDIILKRLEDAVECLEERGAYDDPPQPEA